MFKRLCVLMVCGVTLVSQSNFAQADSISDQIKSLQEQIKKLQKQVNEKQTTPANITAMTDTRYVKKAYDWSGMQLGVLAGAGMGISQTNMDYGTGDVGMTDHGLMSSSYYDGGFGNGFGDTANFAGPDTGANGSYWNSTGTHNMAGGCSGDYCGSYYSINTEGAGSGQSSAATTPNSFQNKKISGLIGIEIGDLIQSDNFVYGWNADLMGLSKPNSSSWDNNGTTSASYTSAGSVTGGNGLTGTDGAIINESLNGNNDFGGSVSVAPNWLATLRGTMGIAQDRVLFFATGGIAIGQVNFSLDANYQDHLAYSCAGHGFERYDYYPNPDTEAYVNINCDSGGTWSSDSSAMSRDVNASWHGHKSQTMLGFALGGGVAYALSDNMILKIDGLYYNLGTFKARVHGTATASVDGGDPQNISVGDITVSQNMNGVLARASVAYKF